MKDYIDKWQTGITFSSLESISPYWASAGIDDGLAAPVRAVAQEVLKAFFDQPVGSWYTETNCSRLVSGFRGGIRRRFHIHQVEFIECWIHRNWIDDEHWGAMRWALRRTIEQLSTDHAPNPVEARRMVDWLRQYVSDNPGALSGDIYLEDEEDSIPLSFGEWDRFISDLMHWSEAEISQIARSMLIRARDLNGFFTLWAKLGCLFDDQSIGFLAKEVWRYIERDRIPTKLRRAGK